MASAALGEQLRHPEQAHNAEKEIANLIRLQILTPITILLSIGANLVASLAIHPSIGEVSDDYLTILTPRKSFIAAYWLVLYLLQIGFCIILAAARKQETRTTLVNAVGFRFAFANISFALWTFFFAIRQFLAAEICLSVTLVLMASIWIHLYQYGPDFRKRPLDAVFIHAPMRMFVVVLLTVDVWQNGLLAFRWYKYVGEQPHSPDRPGKWEGEHGKHTWIAFGVIMAVGLLNAVVVYNWRDFVWAIAVVFLYVALLLKGPKPAQIFIPLVLLAVLQFVALVAGLFYHQYKTDKVGAIALPEDGEIVPSRPISHHTAHEETGSTFAIQGGQPREITD